jgi:type I restriction enzyme S subunit
MPKGWILAPLGELTRINPREFDREPGDEDHVSFVPMTLVEAGSGRLDSSGSRLWRDVRKGYTRFQENDVLFAKITPCMENAKIALAANLISGRGAGSTEFHVIRPTAAILSKFILYYLLQERVRREARLSMRGAAGQLRVPPEFIDRMQIPVAPVPEQARIIQEIEKQFTRLDAAVAALKRVRANLKRYRAAVLKAACEGHLVPTEAEIARRENRTYEPASALLERILAERRARWEAAQKSRYKEPQAPITDMLPKLPEGWTWANWEQLSPRVTVGHVGPMKTEYVPDGFPFLRSQNVRENKFDAEGLLHIPKEFHCRLSKSLIRAGDLVVVRSGSVGTTCVVPDHLGEANRADLVIIKQPIQTNSWYGCYYMNSSAKRYVHAGKVGVALTHFNTKSVAQLPVALPPRPEQDRIAAEVQRRLSVIDEIEMQADADLKRANGLRQAILRRAFEGKLVPQDPSDETARTLLERIRAEHWSNLPNMANRTRRIEATRDA